MTVSMTVISVFVLFAFFLLEYATFFWFKRRWGALAAFGAANVVAFVFGGAILVPLEVLGVLDLIEAHAAQMPLPTR